MKAFAITNSLFLIILCAATLAADETIWSGGSGTISDQVRIWNTATLELKEFGSEIEGKLKTEPNRIYKVNGSMQNDEVTLTLNRRNQSRTFTGQHTEGVLTLTADDNEVPGRLVLRRVISLSDSQLAQRVGMYEFDDGNRVGIRAAHRGLAWSDYHSGKVRRLYPISEVKFVAGSALMMPDSTEFVVRFQVDADQKSAKVIVESADGKQTRVGRRQSRGDVQEFEYASFDGTMIRGSLHLPASEGPHPAIVWVHGSGKVTRENSGSWPIYFADLGFAVLAVDKRGMGESEGTYHLPNGGGRDNFPHMRRRSRDVAAAVAALGKRDDVDATKIGLVGGSQAGWVIPMAVDHAKIAFGIILSGGATPLSVEGRYSRLASERSSGADLRPVGELVEELRSYQPKDKGISAELSRMDYPCLWLYGLKDRSNPSLLCAELIKQISDENDRDFTVKLFPEGNHALLVCKFGGSAEIGSLDRMVPGMHETIEAWLREKGLASKPSR